MPIFAKDSGRFLRNDGTLICMIQLEIIIIIFFMDAGVDRTIIDCWENQLGQMADFLPLFFNV